MGKQIPKWVFTHTHLPNSGKSRESSKVYVSKFVPPHGYLVVVDTNGQNSSGDDKLLWISSSRGSSPIFIDFLIRC